MATAKKDEPMEVQEKKRAVTPVQRADQWGPFADYEYVNTAFGEYGVPAGHILTFEMQNVRNKKTNEMEMRPMPQYEAVDIGDKRLEPSPAILEAQK